MDKIQTTGTISYYAWQAQTRGFGVKPTEKEIKCAWCGKSRAEISKTEDPNKHVENHDREKGIKQR